MLHRVVLGSVERFTACLTEHYMGDFPLWLAPVQVQIIPIREDFRTYAESVRSALEDKGIRAEINLRNETLNKRIRQAEVARIPYSVIIGEREVASRTVAVRKRRDGDQGAMSVDDFIGQVSQQINTRSQ
jgi:threonyl-tRNA synthetase